MPRPCSEVLVQRGKLLIKNRGGWLFVLISLLEGLFIFCFVMVRIHFGPGLCSVPLSEPSAFPLRLNPSLPPFFHFKDEDRIWMDQSIQWTENLFFIKSDDPNIYTAMQSLQAVLTQLPPRILAKPWWKLSLRGVCWLVRHCSALDNELQSWDLNLWFDFLNLHIFFFFFFLFKFVEFSLCLSFY